MENRKTVLITGITGQDGSYLAEFLLKKDYKVHGIVRRVAAENQAERSPRISHILDRIVIHEGDITNRSAVSALVETIRPDEVYHLAAQSFVGSSFKEGQDFTTFDTNINGTHHVLSAVKKHFPKARIYFAATSEMFGQVTVSPQNENTLFNPVSPYAISKTAGFYLTKMYREAKEYELFACSGILFNHESPRRGSEFVTRKITRGAARIKAGFDRELRLGNLDAKRDWGFAGDYVEAMWRMLQQDSPKDYVIGTGKSHSVRKFVEAAFAELGLNWKEFVVVDEKHLRPLEVRELCADASLAEKGLGWKSRISFEELVRMMVRADWQKVVSEIRE